MSVTDDSRPASARRFGRVHSPTRRESLRITFTGVRNRLGRTVLTLLGIVLGIAFLMSTLVGADLREALREERERRTAVQSMYGVLRAEVGDPAGKTVVLAAATGSAGDPLLAALLAHLGERSPTLKCVELAGRASNGPDASDGSDPSDSPAADVFAGAAALIAWRPAAGDAPALALLAGRLRQPVVLVLGDAAPIVAASADVRVRPLLPVTEDAEDRRRQEARQTRSRAMWLVAVSLLVATIGISNALGMSVTERYREIGTMKCLGALNSFVIRLLLLESSFLGVLGALLGVLLGSLFALLGHSGTYGSDVVLAALDGGRLAVAGATCLAIGWVVAMVAAVYPARIAARMVPADALRTEV